MLERSIDIGFLSEIWEDAEDKQHQLKIQEMCEMEGLQYISTPRATRGGGAALVINLKKFSVEKINIPIPRNLEVIWGLLRPKCDSSRFKTLIVCSFYSPPHCGKNSKMADHLVSTLHMLNTKYSESGIIMGADKNDMDNGHSTSPELWLKIEAIS